MSIQNPWWYSIGGDPVTGRTPTSVSIYNGQALTGAQRAFVQGEYRKFCNQVELTCFPTGYFNVLKKADDGTVMRMMSINGIHKVEVWPPPLPGREVIYQGFLIWGPWTKYAMLYRPQNKQAIGATIPFLSEDENNTFRRTLCFTINDDEGNQVLMARPSWNKQQLLVRFEKESYVATKLVFPAPPGHEPASATQENFAGIVKQTPPEGEDEDEDPVFFFFHSHGGSTTNSNLRGYISYAHTPDPEALIYNYTVYTAFDEADRGHISGTLRVVNGSIVTSGEIFSAAVRVGLSTPPEWSTTHGSGGVGVPISVVSEPRYTLTEFIAGVGVVPLATGVSFGTKVSNLGDFGTWAYSDGGQTTEAESTLAQVWGDTGPTTAKLRVHREIIARSYEDSKANVNYTPGFSEPELQAFLDAQYPSRVVYAAGEYATASGQLYWREASWNNEHKGGAQLVLPWKTFDLAKIHQVITSHLSEETVPSGDYDFQLGAQPNTNTRSHQGTFWTQIDYEFPLFVDSQNEAYVLLRKKNTISAVGEGSHIYVSILDGVNHPTSAITGSAYYDSAVVPGVFPMVGLQLDGTLSTTLEIEWFYGGEIKTIQLLSYAHNGRVATTALFPDEATGFPPDGGWLSQPEYRTRSGTSDPSSYVMGFGIHKMSQEVPDFWLADRQRRSLQHVLSAGQDVKMYNIISSIKGAVGVEFGKTHFMFHARFSPRSIAGWEQTPLTPERDFSAVEFFRTDDVSPLGWPNNMVIDIVDDELHMWSDQIRANNGVDFPTVKEDVQVWWPGLRKKPSDL
jgi:hypothetical protein